MFRTCTLNVTISVFVQQYTREERKAIMGQDAAYGDRVETVADLDVRPCR